MTQYQSFPGRPGASDSIDKLMALALPPLAGKAFLDVGCNEGFFCGYAFFEGASRSVGWDREPAAIARARERFPHCRFVEADWETLPHDEQFDVILCASAIHYAADQIALVARLMQLLRPDGVFVLEMGVMSPDPQQPGAMWLSARRQNGSVCRYPTMRGIAEELLAPYAWKLMGESVSQPGDPVPRRVFHVRRLRPYAVLLMGESGSGKSFAASRLFAGLPVISGDALVWRACEDDPAISAPLRQALSGREPSATRLDRLIDGLFASEAWRHYILAVHEAAGGRGFVFDGWIPRAERHKVAALFTELGYQVAGMDLPAPAYQMGELGRQARLEARKYQLFLSAYLSTLHRSGRRG